MTPLVEGQWSICCVCAQSGQQLSISFVVVGNVSVMGGSHHAALTTNVISGNTVCKPFCVRVHVSPLQ